MLNPTGENLFSRVWKYKKYYICFIYILLLFSSQIHLGPILIKLLRNGIARLRCNEGCNPLPSDGEFMPSFCKRHLTMAAPYSLLSIDNVSHSRLTSRRFPYLFSRNESRQTGSTLVPRFARDYLYSASRRSTYQSIGEREYTFSRLYTLRVAGCGRKSKQDDERDTLRALRNGPVLMDS